MEGSTPPVSTMMPALANRQTPNKNCVAGSDPTESDLMYPAILILYGGPS